MASIRVWNVKHGDLGVYSNRETAYSCMLDCGTTQPKSHLRTLPFATPRIVIGYVADRIASHGRVRDALVSHYHDDHYNGIGAFKRYGLPFFRNIYIPYINFRGDYARQIVYSMCLLDVSSRIFNIPFTLLRKFSGLFLDNYAHQNIMVGRGDYLSDIKDALGAIAEVLWPPIYIFGRSKRLDKLIDNLIRSLNKQDLKTAINETEHYFSQLHEKLLSTEFGRAISNRVELGEFQIHDLISDENNNENTLERSRKEDAFKKLKGAVKDHLDALSIVFRVSGSLLWVGDVNETVLQILGRDLKNDVKYFKLPHHGTIDVSSLSLKASKYVVSIADGKHYGGRRYRPMRLANLAKASNDQTQILCTDGHRGCEKSYLSMPFGAKEFPCSRHTKIMFNL